MILDCRCLIMLQNCLMEPLWVTWPVRKEDISVKGLLSSTYTGVADIVSVEERGIICIYIKCWWRGRRWTKGGVWGQVVLHRGDTNLPTGRKGATLDGEGRMGEDCGRWMFRETTINCWVLSRPEQMGIKMFLFCQSSALTPVHYIKVDLIQLLCEPNGYTHDTSLSMCSSKIWWGERNF